MNIYSAPSSILGEGNSSFAKQKYPWLMAAVNVLFFCAFLLFVQDFEEPSNDKYSFLKFVGIGMLVVLFVQNVIAFIVGAILSRIKTYGIVYAYYKSARRIYIGAPFLTVVFIVASFFLWG
ncbi:hypothetical protein [Teredinibacter haidensis]|uniref:hypothetical protein n=1 Tax=Teredinibacter haidensis TaxID=2731755 RepID=UPI000948FB01|nr:hypothetical protein [Teredinibacter haidensis]